MPTFYSQLQRENTKVILQHKYEILSVIKNKNNFFTSIGLLFIIANNILLASVALSTPKSMKRSSILGGNTKYWRDRKRLN